MRASRACICTLAPTGEPGAGYSGTPALPLAGVTETGLGMANLVLLAQAQAKALELQRQVALGICPIQQKKLDKATATTFAQAADDWIKTHKPGWRSESQMRNVRLLLRNHGGPLANIPVDEITADRVQATLAPLWIKAPAQARRTLAMWERVLDYARAKGMRNGDNPAVGEGCTSTDFLAGEPRTENISPRCPTSRCRSLCEPCVSVRTGAPQPSSSNLLSFAHVDQARH